MTRSADRVVYLDNAATSPASADVIQGMVSALTKTFGNPSSRHCLGLLAEKAVRGARASVAQRFDVPPRQVLFTSGGTEALALAIWGIAKRHKRTGQVLVSAVEHAAVLKTVEMVKRLGHEVVTVPVCPGGWVEPSAIQRAMTDRTFLVCVMHVNNEIGIEQPVAAIAQTVKRHSPRCSVLVDTIQSFGVLDTSLGLLGADFAVASAHKLHGPKGVGALAMRSNVQLEGLWGGGSQEQGIRPGTENVPAIVGFGIAAKAGRGDAEQLKMACHTLVQPLIEAVSGAYVVGDAARLAPHIVAVAVPGRRSAVVVNALSDLGICVSSGSACSGRRSERSHVLEALGIPREHGVIRLSPSRFHTSDELQQAASVIAETTAGL